MYNNDHGYDDLTRRFARRDPWDGAGFTEPFCGHGTFGRPGGPGPDSGRPPMEDFGGARTLPYPPGPRSFVGPDPGRIPEFPPFGEMEDYGSLPVDGKLLHRLRALSHKLHFLSGSIGGQKRILTILAACPGITQRQLMDLVRVRASSLSEVLGKLEAAGQIRRQVCPFDHRMVQVYLTDAGESTAAALKDGTGNALFDCLSADEKSALLTLLEKLDGAWADACPPPPRRPAETHKV